MKIFVWLLVLCAVPTVGADELILTSGKKLVWKTLTDNGDTYTVEDADGKRLLIQKSDVERIEKTLPPQPAPLAGASFTFDKKVKLISVNLLPHIDLKKAIVFGDWSFVRGALVGVSPLAANARLEFPMEAPEEYDLTIDVARTEGVGDFDIGLVAGGRQFIMAFDAVNMTLNGIGIVDGKTIKQHEHVVKGRFFVDQRPRTIVCMVRKDHLIVQVDGKDYLSYSGGWSKVDLNPAHAVRNPKVPFLIIWNGTFSVSRALISYPKTNP